MEKSRSKPEIIPIGVPCFDFTVDGKQLEKRTVIIAPIVCEEMTVGVWKTAWACSRGRFCKDGECCYSKHSSRNGEPNVESLGSYGDR